MSDISTLKNKNNMKTFHLVLLTLVTLGLYPIVWLYKTATIVEEVTRIKTLGFTFLVVYLSTGGIGGVLLSIPDGVVMAMGLILTLVNWLLAIAWCFRVRRALRAYALDEHQLELGMNRVFSVLFTFYHVNYCINDMQRALQKRQRRPLQ